jgi:hypothetical protein
MARTYALPNMTKPICDFASIHYMGRDEQGNEIYVPGQKKLGQRFSHL